MRYTEPKVLYHIQQGQEYKRKFVLKIILLVTIVLIGVIGTFIGNNPMILFVICGCIVFIPWIIILLKKDFSNGLLIWLLLVLLSGAMGELSLPMVPDVSFYRIMWILLILTFLAQIALRERDFLPITKIEIMMILFCIICLISMIKAGTIFEREHGLLLRDFLNGYAIPFSIFFLAKHTVNSEKKIKRLFQFLLILGIYLGFTGIFEHFHLRALVFPRYIMDPNVGIHWGRARGPFVMASVNGTVLGMIFLVSIYLVIHKQRKSSRIFYGIPTALIPITIFFTYTRACWLGLILSILTVALFYPRLRKIFFFSFFIMFIIAIFNWSSIVSEDRTIGGVAAASPVYYRLNLYAISLSMFLDRPIFGFGFNTFEKASSKYFYKVSGIPYIVGVSQHDTLVSILVELGLVGLIPILLVFFYIFRHSIGLYRYLPTNSFSSKGLVAIFWGISIVFIVNMQFIQMRFFLFPNALFFLLAGIIVGLNQKALLNKNYMDQGKLR